MHCLGNDVVDLKHRDNRRSAANPRFAARVLTPAERQAGADALQHRWLWACWSAKEAAYKALARHQPGLPFLHRKFAVTADTTTGALLRDEAGGGTATGIVRHGEDRLPVAWQWTTDWIHCVAGTVTNTGQVERLRDSPVVTASGKSPQSSGVRELARALLEKAGICDARVERRGTAQGRPGAPLVIKNGAPVPGCVVSLSHDGRFVAAAISVGRSASVSR